MKKLLKWVGVLLLVIVAGVAAAYGWLSYSASRVLSQTIDTHTVDFPIPFPLEPTEPGYDAMSDGQRQELALGRARERGQHLVFSRYHCVECHGQNFAGGTMVDAFPVGSFFGPNLTSGAGGRTAGYTANDWDRIVRHAVRRDGHPAVMPSVDFQNMSDQELSDIVAFIQSVPAVDAVVPEPSYGPVGKYMLVTGQVAFATLADARFSPHPILPPATAASAEFGRHIAGACVGCHRGTFTGGPVPGGDPSWPPAKNLTPHPAGIGPWTYEQFVTTMREGRRPDGTALLAPMTLIMPYARRMSDVELEALWLFLRSLPVAEQGQ